MCIDIDKFPFQFTKLSLRITALGNGIQGLELGWVFRGLLGWVRWSIFVYFLTKVHVLWISSEMDITGSVV